MAQQAGKDRVANKEALLKKKRSARTAKKAFKAQGKSFMAEASKQGDICANGFTVE
jgi:hypothetical protein